MNVQFRIEASPREREDCGSEANEKGRKKSERGRREAVYLIN